VKRRKMGQSDQGSTKVPPARFMGQQHGAPFIPMPPQTHQTPQGYFYPPYPYPMQHMWFNLQQCDSGQEVGQLQLRAKIWRRHLLFRHTLGVSRQIVTRNQITFLFSPQLMILY
jgi:hypothetical protein